MNFKTLLEALSSVIVALVALAMLVLYVNDRGSAARDMDPEPIHVQDWQDWHVDGIRRGPEDAPMVVAAFTDFRCPYCRRLAPVLDSLMDLFPDQVAVEHFHFPLTGHDKAVPASMASECAERQMVFGEMYRILFAQMDSTGLRSWSALAADAGVRDLEAFEECMKLPIDSFPRITAGRELGVRIGVTGTPSVWVNGTVFRGRALEDFRRKAEDLGLRS